MENVTKTFGKEMRLRELILWLLVFAAAILLIAGIIKTFFM
ncbi:MAG: hypothetical protein AABX82_03870 [Nanoarchaeota archaeon]